jgi:hypothetical protein
MNCYALLCALCIVVTDPCREVDRGFFSYISIVSVFLFANEPLLAPCHMQHQEERIGWLLTSTCSSFVYPI